MALDKIGVLNATCKYAVLEESGSTVSSGRVAITWTLSGSDAVCNATEAFTGTAGAAVDAVGFYDAASAGNYYGNAPLSSADSTPLSFNTDGKYNVVGLTVTG